MKRRTLPTAAALAVTAALLMTACDSGADGSPSSDKIAGTGETGASASKSADGADAAKRPPVTLPSDDQLVFEPEETGNSKKDTVLRDNAERLRAIDAAIVKGDAQYAPVYFYSSGDAATSAAKSIQSYVDDGLSVTGEVRYFQRSVTFRQDGSARLTYCADESKGFAKERKTGKTLRTPVDKSSFVFYDTRLDLSSKGVWRTTGVTSDRGADRCQP